MSDTFTPIGAAATAALKNADPFSWWQEALAGRFGPIHEGEPQQGFYRVRQYKNGPWLPVAIWFEDGEAIGLRNNTTVDPDEIWTWCCRNPITFEAYDAAINGEPWGDDPPPPATIGHNLPPDPCEAIRAELTGEESEIKRWLATNPIVDQTSADRAANWENRISKLGKDAEEARKAEKKPHDDAGKAVQAKWKPVVDQADSLKRLLKDGIGVYLRKKAAEEAARQAEERAKAEAEAKRLAEERAEAERIGAPPPPEPPPAPPPAPAKPVGAGTAGRKVALRTVRVALIEDYSKALAFFAENSEVRELVQRLAQRSVIAGATVPGVTVSEKKEAA